MVNTIELLLITTSTIIKIMLCSAVGMYVSKFFSYGETSTKGLTYISVHIFLPCLLFSNLCLSVTWEAITKFYWAPLLSLLPIAIGAVACNTVFRWLLAPRYQAMLLLGCLFQNGLTFPLGVILNLKGIPWFDNAAVGKASSYVFLYNVCCSLGLWGIGEPVIALAKEREVAEEKRLRSQAQDARAADADDDDDDSRNGSGLLANRSFDFPYAEPSRKLQVVSPADRAAPPFPTTSTDEALTPPREGVESEGVGGEETGKREGDGEPLILVAVHDEEQKRLASAQEQRQWYRPPDTEDKPLHLQTRGDEARTKKKKKKKASKEEPSELDKERHEKRQVGVMDLDGNGIFSLSDADLGIVSERTVEETQSQRMKRCVKRAVSSPPVFVSVLAIVISLVPPLRWLAESFAGQVLLGGFSIIGGGAIPLQLLVLGLTVVSSKPKDAQTTAAAVAETSAPGNGSTAATNTSTNAGDGNTVIADSSKHNTLRDCIESVVSPYTMFVVCTVVLRLVIMPAICFLCIHLLRVGGIVPDERPFLIAMLIATCAPSAMNGSLICAMHNYHQQEYSRMIFVMYVACVPTTAIWLFFYILYLGS